jgi:hypothetical protein
VTAVATHLPERHAATYMCSHCHTPWPCPVIAGTESATHSARTPVMGDPDVLASIGEQRVGWDLSGWFRIAFNIDAGDGLTVTSTSHHEVTHHTVTPTQLIQFASGLIWLASEAGE